MRWPATRVPRSGWSKYDEGVGVMATTPLRPDMDERAGPEMRRGCVVGAGGMAPGPVTRSPTREVDRSSTTTPRDSPCPWACWVCPPRTGATIRTGSTAGLHSTPSRHPIPTTMRTSSHSSEDHGVARRGPPSGANRGGSRGHRPSSPWCAPLGEQVGIDSLRDEPGCSGRAPQRHMPRAARPARGCPAPGVPSRPRRHARPPA